MSKIKDLVVPVGLSVPSLLVKVIQKCTEVHWEISLNNNLLIVLDHMEIMDVMVVSQHML